MSFVLPVHRLLAGTVFAALAVSAASAEPSLVKTAKVAPGLYEIVASPATGRVYVASAGTREETGAKILALDPQTLDVRETIDLGADAGFGLGLNSRTKTLYATRTRNGSVAAIDLTTGKVVATMAEGEKAHVRQVVVDEEANRAYVSVFARADEPSAIWVIDGATNRIASVIGGLKGGVSGLVLDPAHNRLFASAMTTNEVHEIDLATGKVARSFPSGGKGAINLAYDAAGDRLFVTHQESGNLVVLNAKDGAVLKAVPTGEGALGVSYDPARNMIYVANRRAGWVTLVSGETLAPVANIVAGSMPNTVAVDRQTGNVYVSSKLKSAGRGGPPMIDPNGDTVTLIKP
ncbi:MAG TPA: YncE family protein [Xanthobacteraceae bacterium]|nr:YncE family protein [Xanthobacteraceae bacterium]